MNLRLNNNSAPPHRDGNGHPGDKATLFQPAAFKVDGGGRVAPAIMRSDTQSHYVVTDLVHPLFNDVGN